MIEKLFIAFSFILNIYSPQENVTTKEHILSAVTGVAGIREIIIAYLNIHDQLISQTESTDYRFEISPDSRYKASIDFNESVSIRELLTGGSVHTYPIKSPTKAIKYSSDGRFIVVQRTKGDISFDTVLIDTQTNQIEVLPVNDQHFLNQVTYSPDNKHLACAAFCGDKSIQIIDMEKRNLHKTLTNCFDRCAAYTSNGEYFVSAADVVHIFDGKTYDLLNTLHTGKEDQIWSVAFLPNSTTFATGGKNKRIMIWRINKIDNTHTIDALAMLTDHTEQVYSVAYSPDGTILASSSGDESIKLWDVANEYKLIHTYQLNQGLIWSVQFSRDNKYLAAVTTGTSGPSKEKKKPMFYVWLNQATEFAQPPRATNNIQLVQE